MIRAYVASDAPDVARLFAEMQAYYGVPCPPHETIVSDLRALPDGVRLILAERDGIVGCAAVCAVYPGPGLRKGLFLKELFVASRARGQGIGRALMAHVATLAVAEGYGRLDWTADPGKPDLIRFYEALGANIMPDKVFFRLTGDALTALRSQGN